jgi:hypothetical protein
MRKETNIEMCKEKEGSLVGTYVKKRISNWQWIRQKNDGKRNSGRSRLIITDDLKGGSCYEVNVL